MKKAIEETDRRRKKQYEYNIKNNIDPETIFKTRDEILRSTQFADTRTVEETKGFDKPGHFDELSRDGKISFLMKSMMQAAQNLDFETAALIRDELKELQGGVIKKGQKRGR
jgi:excinuclease ABC subunit B